MDKFTGYRTIISLGISLVLKALVLKGILAPGSNDPQNVSIATDAVMLVLSGVADIAGIYFKLKAPKPGPFSPEGKALREYQKQVAANQPPDPAKK